MSTYPARQRDAVHFATQMFDLLDRAATTSTYKYAVLLGLLDCCQSQVEKDGTAPTSITTWQLAEKVLDVYWSHSKPFPSKSEVLRQNSGSQAKIIRQIEEFRNSLRAAVTSPYVAKSQNPKRFRRLVHRVEWTLIKMPLPKLQRLGPNENRFLYEIGWADDITKR